MKYKIFKPEAIHELGQRENQEDSIFPALGQTTTDDRLFILCDGMGGHSKGEVASQTVCAALSEYIIEHFSADEVFTDEKFMEALAAAYRALDEKDDGALKKMGCTLTFLYLHRGGATVAHIGDSRVYHLRPETGQVLYRTRDHSLVYDLFEVGELSLAEMATAPNKNIITRVMQPLQEQPCRADVVHITDIQPGDYFYLCSDGMLEIMNDRQLLSILGNEDLTPQGKTKRLIAETVDNADNHTALIIRIEELEKEPDFDFDDTEKAMRQRNRVLLAEENPDLAAATQMPPVAAAPMMPPTYEEPAEDNSDLVVPEQYDQYGNVEGEVEIVQQGEPLSPNMGGSQVPPKKNNMLAYVLAAVAAAAIGCAVFFFLNNNEEDKKESIYKEVNDNRNSQEHRVSRPIRQPVTTKPEKESTSEAKRKVTVEIENNKPAEKKTTQTQTTTNKPETKKADTKKADTKKTEQKTVTDIMNNKKAENVKDNVNVNDVITNANKAAEQNKPATAEEVGGGLVKKKNSK